MKRLIMLPIVAVVFMNSSFSQDKYRLADEIIVSKPVELIAAQKDRIYRVAGYNKNMLVYQLNLRQKNERGHYSTEAATKLYYDENKKNGRQSISVIDYNCAYDRGVFKCAYICQFFGGGA